ncbi:efflux RND transporter permease subunit [Arsukibacterium indicum]|uniref:Efflux RND transporter permease subunit n=1 Tax=Arsukibacterium indicum TaxID=2848612 RepID=A0ABS6MIK3_9GAMM|nr:efflux RND transporter permease subunit [Arsukibacterium indicum]MBV2128575.1 efflux RND transporter permease subunit [Arsukibacterium indicum]
MKLVDVAVARPVTIWMFTLGILLFGLVSAGRLAVNLLPDLSYPSLTIRTEYVGAAPAEVEQLVSKPIEEALGIVKGVHKVQSVSRSGRSDVVLEFDWGTDMDLAMLEVREKLDVLMLPLDIEKPLLLRFNPNLDPVVRLALSREGGINSDRELVSLRTYAEEDLRRKLEAMPGIAAVRPDGGLNQEIQVLVDPNKLSQLQLDIGLISSRLAQENINLAGGRLETPGYDFLVRTINQFADLSAIENLYLATVGNSQIRLKDVATVVDAFADRKSVTYVNGAEAIEVAIYKEGDANTVKVAESLLAQLTNIRKGLPQDYTLTLVYDQSAFIKQAISEVKSAGIVGGLLAMLVLYLFLRNVWATVIISVSIPVSIVATFNLMYGQGITLNMMSLGGIALAVGLLVDNAIVVLENIARHKEQGKSAPEAARTGTGEVAMAITASTLTTVAVFFPLVFVEGIAGQLFKDQALTVTFALLVSLVVALTLIPTMAARQRRVVTADSTEAATPKVKGSRWYHTVGRVLWWVPGKIFKGLYFVLLGLLSLFTLIWRAVSRLLGLLFKPLLFVVKAALDVLTRAYRRLLGAALQAKWLTVGSTLLVAGLCYSLLPRLGADVIPELSQGEFYVEVQLPFGSAIEQTDAVLKELAGVAAPLAGVERSYGQVGTGAQMTVDPAIGGSHWGRLNIVMQAGTDEQAERQVTEQLRQHVAGMAGVKARFDRPELFSFATPLEIELTGFELADLKQAADQLLVSLAAEPRFTDVKTSLRPGQPEITLYFDHARLAQLGMTAQQVAKRVAVYVGGEVAGQYSVNDRKIDIRVRLAEEYRQNEQQLASLIINPGSAQPLPLSAVADIRRELGPSEITRVAQQRVAIVSANLAFGDLEQATAIARDIVAKQSLPFGVSAVVAGQSEEMQRAYSSLFMALLLAVFLVYLVMASQFENLLQPLLILFTVPLAGAGAILGLWLTDTRLSVIVFIGLIMLAGIVVNNAIVLIDRINQLRQNGTDLTEAIVEGGASRLRPVLMTTLTTVLGLLPMALGGGDGSEIRAPMAVTVIFGLLLSTLLTLVFIPVLYALFTRERQPGEQTVTTADVQEAL